MGPPWAVRTTIRTRVRDSGEGSRCGLWSETFGPQTAKTTHAYLEPRSPAALSFIRILSQIAQILEELCRLANEKPVTGEPLHRSHRRALGGRGANDGNWRELPAQEHRWFGHDEVGLKILSAERLRIQIVKYD